MSLFRCVAIDATTLKVPLLGSYSSTVLLVPPAMRTWPLVSRAASPEKRAFTMLPVLLKLPFAGS